MPSPKPTDDPLVFPFDEFPREYHAGVSVLSHVGQHIVEVTGRFRLPDIPPNVRTVGDQTAFWVGISGGSVVSQLVQAGVDVRVVEDGLHIRPFMEWIPDPPDYSPVMPALAPGHVIEITIRLQDSWHATVTFRDLGDPSGTPYEVTGFSRFNWRLQQPMMGVYAEWMVEPAIFVKDSERYRSIHPLANFGEVVFTHCSATTNKGNKLDLSESNGRGIRNLDKSKIADTEVDIGSGQGISGFTVRHKGHAKSSEYN
ncbi:concanavalin A-like lectin/glucanase domain-containing protein [Lentinula raphanica]|uniref:Concanavalin A-like lectin/glucanase domain-containing protein n=1 Tax=Lentinula raphanica TaxID=153919 RepID=A0AA38P455_9AGAR|nr:concanavalin A-like lectin/glucanase domain-containing protein [Lentinula raphanica]